MNKLRLFTRYYILQVSGLDQSRRRGTELPFNIKRGFESSHILKSNCLSNNLVFLDNSNINCSHLNYRGLHLNRDGSALLQNNISNILKSND